MLIDQLIRVSSTGHGVLIFCSREPIFSAIINNKGSVVFRIPAKHLFAKVKLAIRQRSTAQIA